MSEPALRLARPEDIPAIEALLTAEWLPPFQIREFVNLAQHGRITAYRVMVSEGDDVQAAKLGLAQNVKKGGVRFLVIR